MNEQTHLSNVESLLPTLKDLENYFDRLWPICRTLAGAGFRESLKILQEIIPFKTHEFKSGSSVLDWTIPDEWDVKSAYIENENGMRIIDFSKNNLHLVGYSESVDEWVDLETLNQHLHSLPEQPNAIPYVTSYYQKRWGFCMTHEQRQKLKHGKYHVVIDSKFTTGKLTIGHFLLPATEKTEDEFLLSSYLCHPSMANNELSGPLVLSYLYQALSKIKKRRYNYRFVIVPETIGSIAYLSEFGEGLKKNCKGGLVVNCCGDDKKITYKRSRHGNAQIDRCVLNVLSNYEKTHGKNFKVFDFFPSGSDERQYCSPGFNLPVGSLMRSMYGTYPEYHTSLDNKSFISFAAMRETVLLYLQSLSAFEQNEVFTGVVMHGEPMLGRRGLYPTLSSPKQMEQQVTRMMYLLNFSDGKHDLCSIAEKSNCSILDLAPIAAFLKEKGLLTSV